METRTGIIIIAAITIVLSMSAIFAGCNEAFSNSTNSVSSQKVCDSYSTVRPANALYSPFEKCVIKQDNRESLCVDYFWWLKF